MKPMIRYYPGKLIDHYASAKEAAIVSRLKEQPPEGFELWGTPIGCFVSFISRRETWDTKLHFPIGSTIGMPTVWVWNDRHLPAELRYLPKEMIKKKVYAKHSPATMPSSAIRLLWTVTETRVSEAQKVSLGEIIGMGLSWTCYSSSGTPLPILQGAESHFRPWYLTRYPEGNWERDWVEITTIKRREKL